MADHDPITDSTSYKRRRIGDTEGSAKEWDSQDDSGDDLFHDFNTVDTVPATSPQRATLGQKRRHDHLTYSTTAFHHDVDSRTMRGLGSQNGPSQQTQRYVTQPTQPLPQARTASVPQQSQTSSQILVDRSSPVAASPPPKPAPAPFSRPRGSYLASAIAPNGTTFRAPAQIPQRAAPITIDSDEEGDPPVEHSEDETQGMRSNIKPAKLTKGGRHLDSTPNRNRSSSDMVQESLRAYPQASSSSIFSSLMSDFAHQPVVPAYTRDAPSRPHLTGTASAYGSLSRAANPALPPCGSAAAQRVNGNRYSSIEDVEDFPMQQKILRIQAILSNESVQRCHDALIQCKGDVERAKSWLADTEQLDELSSMSPVQQRGVAMTKSQQQAATQSSQPPRAMAKQQVKTTGTIAERYAAMQAAKKKAEPYAISSDQEDDEEEEASVEKPRRRLLQGRRRSPSPPSSPPVKAAPARKLVQRPRQVVVLDDDDEDEAGAERVESEEPLSEETAFDQRLLKFFNECSVRDLAELSAKSEDAIKVVLDKRPFASLEDIRAISNAGPKSRARPVGDVLVDACSDMLSGYEAVDELVRECERIAEPIQMSLAEWGAGRAAASGELELMNLDEAHDSGIGTPASSTASDDLTPKTKGKRRFLTQPKSMADDIKLKDYQLVGLNWLNLLWEKKVSCILADDMGLGKTCQVISFLAHLQERKIDGVHLIIVPGSTLENWLREIQRFAPQLTAFPYFGSDKERPELRERIEEQFNEIDIVVTTYDVAVKLDDNKFLRKHIDPAVCVFDEAHLLRNPYSQRYRMLSMINADFRLFLTGTPLQNNLRELVAILAFIMPEVFADQREKLNFIFNQKATTKDADHAALLSKDRIERARSMMTPFILRRKKAQVLDLPTKHSRVEHCDMTPSQTTHYQSLIEEARQVLIGTGRAAEKAKQNQNIMMKLRQAAIHPMLSRRLYTDAKIEKIVSILVRGEFADNPPEMVRAYITGESKTGQKLQGGDYALHKFCSERPALAKFCLKKQEWMDSGKVQKFKELLEGYVANGDRCLMFSQFTTVMDILESVLETLSIKFLRLDGSTKMDVRQEMIDKFTKETDIPIFMLSTKAGGAGINLAAANKVIIFDSGFNPQDDVQAENRAHRVGQTREVEVVRLVSRGTIEEQIAALGESKLALDERVSGEEGGEKVGKEMVERMFLEGLKKEEEQDGNGAGGEDAKSQKGEKAGKPAKKEKGGKTMDLKDAFKAGMEKKGVKVASKQAQF